MRRAQTRLTVRVEVACVVVASGVGGAAGVEFEASTITVRVDVALSVGPIGGELVIGRDCGARGEAGSMITVQVEVRLVRSITTGPSARCPCVALSA